jgi:hypothetical protein
VGFELTTLVVIGTDCIVRYKCNYHMITTTKKPKSALICKSKITYIMHKETCQWSIQKSEYHKIFLFASLFLFTATETPILQYMVFLHYPVCFSVCIEYVTRQVFKSIDIILTRTFQDLLHLVCHKHHCMFMTTCI